jgi:hypothetical protein
MMNNGDKNEKNSPSYLVGFYCFRFGFLSVPDREWYQEGTDPSEDKDVNG